MRLLRLTTQSLRQSPKRGGQEHEIKTAKDLLSEDKCEYLLADRAYDSNEFREELKSRGVEAIIPSKKNLLSSYDFPGDDIPIVVGSALKALEGDTSEIGVPAIEKLVETMDSYIPEPVRNE